MEDLELEQFYWEFFDKCKPLFFPEQWNKMFLDFSKNELFVLLFLYRNGEVTMTEIASYLWVPLNTVTGVVSRLEKRELLVRARHKEDRRIVIVHMTDTGRREIKELIAQAEYYFKAITSNLSEEEIQTAISLATKIFDIFTNEAMEREEDKRKKVKKIMIE